MKKVLLSKWFYSTVIVALAVGYFSGVHTLIADAAVMVFAPTNCYTAAATTTLAYMTPGTATTTVSCLLGSDGARSARLAIQVNASSTAAAFTVRAEESMDGIDWYPVAQNQAASTTNPFVTTNSAYTTFTFASSTIGGVVGLNGLDGTNNRNNYEIDIPTTMKRVRAYVTLTGANAGVWMQILPRQDIN